MITPGLCPGTNVKDRVLALQHQLFGNIIVDRMEIFPMPGKR